MGPYGAELKSFNVGHIEGSVAGKAKYLCRWSDTVYIKANIVNLRQRGIGNPNPMKLGRCTKELERIYGIRNGSAGKVSLESNNFTPKDKPQTEIQLANQLGITRQTLQNYKKTDRNDSRIERIGRYRYYYNEYRSCWYN